MNVSAVASPSSALKSDASAASVPTFAFFPLPVSSWSEDKSEQVMEMKQLPLEDRNAAALLTIERDIDQSKAVNQDLETTAPLSSEIAEEEGQISSMQSEDQTQLSADGSAQAAQPSDAAPRNSSTPEDLSNVTKQAAGAKIIVGYATVPISPSVPVAPGAPGSGTIPSMPGLTNAIALDSQAKTVPSAGYVLQQVSSQLGVTPFTQPNPVGVNTYAAMQPSTYSNVLFPKPLVARPLAPRPLAPRPLAPRPAESAPVSNASLETIGEYSRNQFSDFPRLLNTANSNTYYGTPGQLRYFPNSIGNLPLNVLQQNHTPTSAVQPDPQSRPSEAHVEIEQSGNEGGKASQNSKKRPKPGMPPGLPDETASANEIFEVNKIQKTVNSVEADITQGGSRNSFIAPNRPNAEKNEDKNGSESQEESAPKQQSNDGPNNHAGTSSESGTEQIKSFNEGTEQMSASNRAQDSAALESDQESLPLAARYFPGKGNISMPEPRSSSSDANSVDQVSSGVFKEGDKAQAQQVKDDSSESKKTASFRSDAIDPSKSAMGGSVLDRFYSEAAINIEKVKASIQRSSESKAPTMKSSFTEKPNTTLNKNSRANSDVASSSSGALPDSGSQKPNIKIPKTGGISKVPSLPRRPQSEKTLTGTSLKISDQGLRSKNQEKLISLMKMKSSSAQKTIEAQNRGSQSAGKNSKPGSGSGSTSGPPMLRSSPLAPVPRPVESSAPPSLAVALSTSLAKKIASLPKEEKESKTVSPTAEQDKSSAPAPTTQDEKPPSKKKTVSWAPEAKLVEVTFIDSRLELIKSWDPDSQITLPFVPNTLALLKATLANDENQNGGRAPELETSAGIQIRNDTPDGKVMSSFEIARQKEREMELRSALQARENLNRRLASMQATRGWEEPASIVLPAECRSDPNSMEEFALGTERIAFRSIDEVQSSVSPPSPPPQVNYQPSTMDSFTITIPLQDVCSASEGGPGQTADIPTSSGSSLTDSEKSKAIGDLQNVKTGPSGNPRLKSGSGGTLVSGLQTDKPRVELPRKSPSGTTRPDGRTMRDSGAVQRNQSEVASPSAEAVIPKGEQAIGRIPGKPIPNFQSDSDSRIRGSIRTDGAQSSGVRNTGPVRSASDMIGMESRGNVGRHGNNRNQMTSINSMGRMGGPGMSTSMVGMGPGPPIGTNFGNSSGINNRGMGMGGKGGSGPGGAIPPPLPAHALQPQALQQLLAALQSHGAIPPVGEPSHGRDMGNVGGMASGPNMRQGGGRGSMSGGGPGGRNNNFGRGGAYNQMGVPSGGYGMPPPPPPRGMVPGMPSVMMPVPMGVPLNMGGRMPMMPPPPPVGQQRHTGPPSMERPRPKSKKRCKYFGTKQGCRDGSSCLFSHER